MADRCTDSEDQTLFSRGTTPLYSADSISDHATNDLPRRVVTRDALQNDQSQSTTTEDDQIQDNLSADIQTSSRISTDHQLYAIPPFDDLLGSVHEKAIDESGFGKLQWILLFVMGAGLMGDSIELLMVIYMLPGAAKDLCMDETMKAWLGAISFAGMMFGAVVWGNFADRQGRRPGLMTSLTVNVIFTVLGSFMPSYWLLLICRLASGLGIGGTVPIVLAYFAEFCPRQGRGHKICLLLLFWVCGGVYVSSLGWLIIPNTELFDIEVTEHTTFHSWRIYMILCTIPALIAITGTCAMPESPRFLLQIGKDLEALAVYRKLYLWNHTEAGAEYEMPEIQLPSNGNIRTIDHQRSGAIGSNIYRALQNFGNSLFMLFVTPLTLMTCVLCLVWFCASFGYHGLYIWFPEHLKLLEQESYFAETNVTSNLTLIGATYSGRLDNVKFLNVTMRNVTFKDVELRHVTFQSCHMTVCYFLNVSSAQSVFLDSFLDQSFFNNTNFYPEDFIRTEMVDTDINNTWSGCHVDIDVTYSNRKLFLESFLTQLALIPTTLLSVYLIDKIGRRTLLVGYVLLSALSVLFIWSSNTETTVVCVNAVYNAVVIGAFVTLIVMTTELYPTHLRSTSLGFLSAVGKMAAIFGNVTFVNMIGMNKTLPVLLTAAIMSLCGLASLKIPESKDKIL